MNTTTIANLAALTMQHMADQAGISVEAVMAAILEGGAARRRFDALMEIGVRTLAQ